MVGVGQWQAVITKYGNETCSVNTVGALKVHNRVHGYTLHFNALLAIRSTAESLHYTKQATINSKPYHKDSKAFKSLNDSHITSHYECERHGTKPAN